jgi:hypothetical protein
MVDLPIACELSTPELARRRRTVLAQLMSLVEERRVTNRGLHLRWRTSGFVVGFWTSVSTYHAGEGRCGYGYQVLGALAVLSPGCSPTRMCHRGLSNGRVQWPGLAGSNGSR